MERSFNMQIKVAFAELTELLKNEKELALQGRDMNYDFKRDHEHRKTELREFLDKQVDLPPPMMLDTKTGKVTPVMQPPADPAFNFADFGPDPTKTAAVAEDIPF